MVLHCQRQYKTKRAFWRAWLTRCRRRDLQGALSDGAAKGSFASRYSTLPHCPFRQASPRRCFGFALPKAIKNQTSFLARLADLVPKAGLARSAKRRSSERLFRVTLFHSPALPFQTSKPSAMLWFCIAKGNKKPNELFGALG